MPDLETVATLIRESAERWYIAIEWIAVLIGLVILTRGIRQLVEVARDRRAGYGNALAMAVAALGLLYLPSAYTTSLQTLYDTDNVLAYAPAANDWSSYVIGACLMIVRLVGLIGFIRGWMALSLIGRGSSAAEGATARGLTFITGGTAAMNIVLTVEFVLGTLGLESPLT